jgi:prepilin-type N-terminal cleavage/methylation domain-containing protein
MNKDYQISKIKQLILRQNKTNSLMELFKTNNKNLKKNPNRKAFSLIELLVVILILGLLVGLVAQQVI